jgi:hypothetical protein
MLAPPATHINAHSRVKGPDPRICRTPRSSRVAPTLRRGHTLTDRDRVDDVPGQPSTSAAATLPLPKNADAVPSPAAASLPRISGILHDPSGPPPAITIAAIPFDRLPTGCTCGSDAPRRPVAPRMATARGTRSLVDWLLPAGGRHPHFLEAGWWLQGAEVRRGTASHLIAIRRRRPWLESRAVDDRTGTPLTHRGTARP